MSGRLAQIAAGLCAALIVATLLIGALGSADWRATVANDGPGCPFRTATGVDCPFCGMTRATLALGAGDFGDALALHPLAPLVLAGVFGLMLVVAIGRTDALLRGRRPLIMLAIIGAVWILRLVLR